MRGDRKIVRRTFTLHCLALTVGTPREFQSVAMA